MQKNVEFNLAVNRKTPEHTAILIARSSEGKYNPMTLSWMMQTSFDPLMFALSIGSERYTLEAVKAAKEFVIAYPSTSMQRDMLLFGSKSGHQVDKLAEAGTKTEKAEKVDSLLLSDAVANFECVYDSSMESGDHIIITGRVVAAHIHDDESVKRVCFLGKGKFGAAES